VPLYTRALQKLKTEMELRFQNAERAKNIRVYNNKGYSFAQAYLKGLILANFDQFIVQNHSGKVVLNNNSANTFLTPTNNDHKYKLSFDWARVGSIDNTDKTAAIQKNTPSLIHMLASVIPFYTKNDKGK
jgi:hypothetical protein